MRGVTMKTTLLTVIGMVVTVVLAPTLTLKSTTIAPPVLAWIPMHNKWAEYMRKNFLSNKSPAAQSQNVNCFQNLRQDQSVLLNCVLLHIAWCFEPVKTLYSCKYNLDKGK